jgi:hypothetical protein
MVPFLRTFEAAAGFARTTIVAILATALAVVAVLAVWALGFSPALAVRDVWLSDKPEAGVLSNAGVILMILAGLTAAYGGHVARSGACVALGVFCVVFAVDDGLMVHDGLPFQGAVYAAYGIGFVGVWSLFARHHGATMLWPLALVLLLFISSAAVDQVRPLLTRHLGDEVPLPPEVFVVLEDLPKLIGILCLSLVAMNEGLNALERHRVAGRTRSRA